MRTKGKAISQAFGIGLGALVLGFIIAYFVIFSGLKTPPNSADGQGGLAEFLRIWYSAIVAGVSGILAFVVTIWRVWPRLLK